MTRPASEKLQRGDAADRAARLAKWMTAATKDGAMPQRKASAVEERGGGLEAAAKAARAAGVHLVLLTDDKGSELVAVSRHPFKILA